MRFGWGHENHRGPRIRQHTGERLQVGRLHAGGGAVSKQDGGPAPDDLIAAMEAGQADLAVGPVPPVNSS
jgi:hypothetical protein